MEHKLYEDKYIEEMISVLKEWYPEYEVIMENESVIIGNFTTISYDDLKPLIHLGITGFHIDSETQMQSHFFEPPQYYDNLKIIIPLSNLTTQTINQKMEGEGT